MKLGKLLALTAAAALTITLAACSGSSNPSSSSSSNGDGAKIAFLVPEDTGSWSLAKDGFEKGLTAACPSCEMLYYAADNDASKQQSQAQTAITQGADILVVSSVDGKASSTIVQAAKSRKIPVLGFGRTPGGAVTATLAWSDETLGKVNAGGLVSSLEAAGTTSGNLVLLHGDATTANTPGMTAGAESAVSGFTIGRSFNIADWSAANAQTSMDQAITALGKENIAGVMGADDNIASGAIASMQRAGITPLPPVTGMGAQTASAIQLMLDGSLTASEFLPYGALGETAAGVAVDYAQGNPPATEGTEKNATGNDVPLYKAPDPVLVTLDNVKSVIIDGGIVSAADICTADYAAKCQAAGLTN